jgi:hypothetical protein
VFLNIKNVGGDIGNHQNIIPARPIRHLTTRLRPPRPLLTLLPVPTAHPLPPPPTQRLPNPPVRHPHPLRPIGQRPSLPHPLLQPPLQPPHPLAVLRLPHRAAIQQTIIKTPGQSPGSVIAQRPHHQRPDKLHRPHPYRPQRKTRETFTCDNPSRKTHRNEEADADVWLAGVGEEGGA